MAANSRFRADDSGNVTPTKKPVFFDIKGNTYKQTLIPKDTVSNNVKKSRQSVDFLHTSNDGKLQEFASTFTSGFMASA